MTPSQRRELLELAGWEFHEDTPEDEYHWTHSDLPLEVIYEGYGFAQEVAEQVADAVLPYGWVTDSLPWLNEYRASPYNELGEYEWDEDSSPTRAEAIEAMLERWLEERQESTDGP